MSWAPTQLLPPGGRPNPPIIEPRSNLRHPSGGGEFRVGQGHLLDGSDLKLEGALSVAVRDDAHGEEALAADRRLPALELGGVLAEPASGTHSHEGAELVGDPHFRGPLRVARDHLRALVDEDRLLGGEVTWTFIWRARACAWGEACPGWGIVWTMYIFCCGMRIIIWWFGVSMMTLAPPLAVAKFIFISPPFISHSIDWEPPFDVSAVRVMVTLPWKGSAESAHGRSSAQARGSAGNNFMGTLIIGLPPGCAMQEPQAS